MYSLTCSSKCRSCYVQLNNGVKIKGLPFVRNSNEGNLEAPMLVEQRCQEYLLLFPKFLSGVVTENLLTRSLYVSVTICSSLYLSIVMEVTVFDDDVIADKFVCSN